MASLEFVRITDDGTEIIVRDEHGKESRLSMDDRLAAALIPRTSPIAGPDALTPREIQARIRAGADVRTLSQQTGTPVDRIMAFAVPILQERAHIAARARTTLVRRASGVGTLEDIVVLRLQPLGVSLIETHWDAHRLDDGRWEVRLAYDTAEGGRVATWLFDAKASVVTPTDEEAHWLMGEPAVVSPRVREVPTKPTLPMFKKNDTAADNVVPLSRARHDVEDDVAEQIDEVLDMDPVDDIDPMIDFEDPEAPSSPTLTAVPAPERPASKKQRRSIPSWDEILFGSPTNEE